MTDIETNQRIEDNNQQENDSNLNIEDRAEKREEPNYTIKYKKYKNVLSIKALMHKIPPQMINFDPTSTHFHLDTLKYTKKYFLHFPYPYGITVDIKEGEEPQATLAHGILTAELPIKTMNEKLLPHRETFAERKKRLSKKRKERDVREKEVAKSENEKAANNNKKQKKGKQANTTKQNPPKKRTTTTQEDLDIVENINKQLDNIRDTKLDKEKSKIEWEQNQVEKKKKKQQKESQVLTAIRESVVEKLQTGKFKNQAPKPKKTPTAPSEQPPKKTNPSTTSPKPKKASKKNPSKNNAPKKTPSNKQN